MKNNIKLGMAGENLARYIFLRYGFNVYNSVNDDHGVDFIAGYNDKFFNVQVKSTTKGKYTFIREDRVKDSDDFLICYIVYDNDPSIWPTVTVFPATLLKHPGIFTYRDYKNPEYGFKKNQAILETNYTPDKFFKQLFEDYEW